MFSIDVAALRTQAALCVIFLKRHFAQAMSAPRRANPTSPLRRLSATAGRKLQRASDLTRPVRRASVFLAQEHFPCYVMPVTKLLMLDQFEPHETLLAAGDLIKCDPTTHRQHPIIFISHQVRDALTGSSQKPLAAAAPPTASPALTHQPAFPPSEIPLFRCAVGELRPSRSTWPQTENPAENPPTHPQRRV